MLKKSPGSHLALAALALALAAGPALARPGCARHDGGVVRFDGDEVMELVHGLDLSAEQRDRLFEISDHHRPALRKLHFAMHDARRSLHGLLAGGYDEARAAAEAAAVGETARALHLERAKMLAEMGAVLTAEQRERLTALAASGRRGHPHGAPL